jgi:prevent-host-death family protein
MSQTTIHEAKTHLSRLIKQALAGEEVVIAKRNKPLVKLVPVQARKTVPRFGGWEGEIWMAEDFDEPLEDFKDYLTVCWLPRPSTNH